MLPQAEEVWNRACAEAGRHKSLTAPGDHALADMVLAHSLAMNGGVLDAVESLKPDELARALDGYRYFGLDAAASVMAQVAEEARLASAEGDALDELEASADERYRNVVPDDDVLVAAFEARYLTDPSDFAPLR